MKTFMQWAEANHENDIHDVLTAVVPGEETDAPSGEDATGEQRVRTGYSGNYPPAYVSAQYPHKYFSPRKSTADLDAQHIDGQPKGK